MDFGRITLSLDAGFGCPAATLVALRQLRRSWRDEGVLMIFEMRTGVKENPAPFSPAGGLLASPGASDYSFRNQLASSFPARRIKLAAGDRSGARGCVARASGCATHRH